MSVNSQFQQIGARHIACENRQCDDFYATDPHALVAILPRLNISQNVWECACGQGHLSKVLEENGHTVLSTDLFDRGFGEPNVDFLTTHGSFDGDIITNPPFRYAEQFVRKALDVVTDDHKVVMFLKIQFLEGKSRRKLFEEFPPEFVYVSTSRIQCAKDGDFEKYGPHSTAMAYAWFVWRKGFKGETTLRWFN